MNRATPEGRGFLYRYDPDGSLHRIFGDVEVPNGLAFSPDGTTLYFCDSPTRRLMTYALDRATGARCVSCRISRKGVNLGRSRVA